MLGEATACHDHKSEKRPWMTPWSSTWPLSAHLTWPCWSSDTVDSSLYCHLCLNTLFSCLPRHLHSNLVVLCFSSQHFPAEDPSDTGHGHKGEIQVPLKSRQGPSPFGTCLVSLPSDMVYPLLPGHILSHLYAVSVLLSCLEYLFSLPERTPIRPLGPARSCLLLQSSVFHDHTSSKFPKHREHVLFLPLITLYWNHGSAPLILAPMCMMPGTAWHIINAQFIHVCRTSEWQCISYYS